MSEIIATKINKIISGGQTGVDSAALDTAIEFKIPHGGWCPMGRLAEDGIIDDRYQLKETDSCDYKQRTRFNVRDSDGTLILNTGKLEGGTALTARYAKELDKPMFIVDLEQNKNTDALVKWLEKFKIRDLNIAGPRESKRNGIYLKALHFLQKILISDR